MMRGTIETDYYSNYMAKKFWEMMMIYTRENRYRFQKHDMIFIGLRCFGSSTSCELI
jgi:hypothetical protein